MLLSRLLLLPILLTSALLSAQPALAEPAPPMGPPGPTRTNGDITLTATEAEAVRQRLMATKPSLSTVTVSSFLFPGSGEAYMGHVDRTMLMWALYLGTYNGVKALVPDTSLTAGQRTSDVIVVGAFMVMAAGSALDSYLLALKEREETDRVLNRITDKTLVAPKP